MLAFLVVDVDDIVEVYLEFGEKKIFLDTNLLLSLSLIETVDVFCFVVV